MSTARERILDRVRKAVDGERDGDWRGELDRRMEQPLQRIRPKLTDDPLAHFVQKLELGSGSCEQLEGWDQVPAAIIRFLTSHGLVCTIRAAPALRGISWGDGLEVSYGNTRGDDLIGVTPAFCAVAETGSVVLLSSESSPTSLNFLPDYHIVIVQQDQLLTHMEDVWTKLRDSGQTPRAINFITGPSKTADIEQTLQIGAHGPRSFHVLYLLNAG